MYEEEQLNAKMQAEKLAYANAGCNQTTAGPKTPYGLSGGALRGDIGEPCRLSLQERVMSQLHRARSESRKCDRLGELQFLLEKNPEVARILDLIEEVRA